MTIRPETTTVRLVEISPPQSIIRLPAGFGPTGPPAPPAPDQPIRFACPVDVDVAKLINWEANATKAARLGFVAAASVGIGIMIGALGTMVFLA